MPPHFNPLWGGRVVRWSWVNFQCRGVLLIWMIVGQGPTALAVGAGGGGLDMFTLNYPFFLLSPSLWETARYRLKYCLKGPLNPKQPTNQINPLPRLHSYRCFTGRRKSYGKCTGSCCQLFYRKFYGFFLQCTHLVLFTLEKITTFSGNQSGLLGP